MIIRKAIYSDDLLSLYESCFIKAHQKIVPSYISLDSLKKKAIENFKTTIISAESLVAEDNDEILGFIVLKPKEGEIVNLYVLPEYQRRGIASALVAAALNWFSSINTSMVSLSVFENNYPALALYKKLGFKEVHNKPCQILNINLVQFTKELKSR